MIFIWGHALNCWNYEAIYILAVYDPSFFNLGEKSGINILLLLQVTLQDKLDRADYEF